MCDSDICLLRDLSGLNAKTVIINDRINDYADMINDLNLRLGHIDCNIDQLITYYEKYGNTLKTTVAALYAQHG